MSVRAVCYIIACAMGLFAGCYSKGGVIHRVEEGESLLQLSHVYQVDVLEILKANPRVEKNELKPGQKLLIPGTRNRGREDNGVLELAGVETVDIDQANQGILQEKAPMSLDTKSAKGPQSAPDLPGKESVMELTFAWPARGVVISQFGKRDQKMHNGIDIKILSKSEIRAATDGKIVYTGNQVQGYGNLMIIRHASNIFSVYAYLGEFLKPIQTVVKKGDVIALGSSNAESFLHFEIRRGKTALDPMKLLPTL